jgi:hypothetical protein
LIINAKPVDFGKLECIKPMIANEDNVNVVGDSTAGASSIEDLMLMPVQKILLHYCTYHKNTRIHFSNSAKFCRILPCHAAILPGEMAPK